MSETQAMKPYVLPTEEGTLEFTGRLIDAVDNDRGDRPRWAELRLYKILTGTGGQMWMLYTIGHTMIYHGMDSTCNKGITTLVEDFTEVAEDAEELEPCPLCLPEDWQDAPPGTSFDLEVTWYTYTPCATAGKVLDALRKEARCVNCWHKPHETWTCRQNRCGCEDYDEAPRPLTAPGRRLIEKVRRSDPEINAAASQRVQF